jgi:hypothetical protein
VSGAAVFKKGIKNSSVVIMKKCGHLPMVERPRDAAEEYLNSLNTENFNGSRPLFQDYTDIRLR